MPVLRLRAGLVLRPVVGRELTGPSPGEAPCPREPIAVAAAPVAMCRSGLARRQQERPAAFSCRSLAAPKASGVPLAGRACGGWQHRPAPDAFSFNTAE